MKLATVLGMMIAMTYAAAMADDLALWYRQPAKQWVEALPLGNGRLGCMVFGGIEQERIQLNEDTLWSGEPSPDSDRATATKFREQVRQLCFEGKYNEADRLAGQELTAKPKNFGSYTTLGDMKFTFQGGPAGQASEYRRDLDLDSALATVRYKVGDGQFTREIFSSRPDEVIVIRLSADKPGRVSFGVTLNTPQEAKAAAEGAEIVLAGKVKSGEMKFCSRLRAISAGGKVEVSGGDLKIDGADSVVLLLAAATDYRGGNPEEISRKQVASAAVKTFDQLRNAQKADHQSLFRRVQLDLGTSDAAKLPTDERLAAVKKGAYDPQLIAMYFQFGRYLLIGCSRPGDMAANLQGIWAEGLVNPWQSDYHTNINLQMNYWPAEVCNLGECTLPLFDYIESLREPGRKTAKIHYNARGWVVHTMSNVWGYTSPGWGISWGISQGGGAWLCRHMWEHYLYSMDKEYLKRAYPTMKESAEFFLDVLTEDPKTKLLVSGPANSPENTFMTADKKRAVLSMGPSMDQEIVWDLFTMCIEASKALGTDEAFRKQLEETRGRLAMPKTGKYGQLQEWMEDFDEPEPGHRHVSHLYALHPGDQITLRGTPELAKAARVSLERRLANGGGHTGWSRAWVINFWARLEEAEKAFENVQALLAKSTLNNLFDTHPPFQIDGNFGGTAGIAEMLIQSHAGEINLLPALPKAWATGSFTGLRARGGYEIDLAWQDGKAVSATLRCAVAGKCRVRFGTGQAVKEVRCGGSVVVMSDGGDGTIVFESGMGKAYEIVFR